MTVDGISDLDLSYTPPLGAPGTPYKSQPNNGPANTYPRLHTWPFAGFELK